MYVTYHIQLYAHHIGFRCIFTKFEETEKTRNKWKHEATMRKSLYFILFYWFGVCCWNVRKGRMNFSREINIFIKLSDPISQYSYIYIQYDDNNNVRICIYVRACTGSAHTHVYKRWSEYRKAYGIGISILRIYREKKSLWLQRQPYVLACVLGMLHTWVLRILPSILNCI